jgi:hypothetical protein
MDKEILYKIKRLKGRAEYFYENKLPVFIKDYYNSFYFCYIKKIEPIGIVVKGFSGVRKGKTSSLLWINIEEIKEYKNDIRK